MKPVLSRLADEQAFSRQELVNSLRNELRVMTNRMAEQGMDVRPSLERSGELHAEALRNAAEAQNNALQQLAMEHAAGRQELIRELRNEFKILARTLATLAEGGREAGRREPEDTVPSDRRRTQKLD